VIVNHAQQYQTIEGFGGFGAKEVWWSSGPFYNTAWLDLVIDDLGLTILRDRIPATFELSNDNSDPASLDLSKFNFTNRAGHHAAMVDRLRASSVGVALMSSVDHYVMSARSTRYSVLFLLAVFAVVWLLEQRGKLRLHPLQYLLVGAALCCFHLMILAFSEHVGFEVAYLAAAGMVTALVVYYSRTVLGSALRSLVVGCTCLCVYAYLYVCLRNEDYALLIGSLGVFFGLAVVMALTRKLDWTRREPVEPATSSRS